MESRSERGTEGGREMMKQTHAGFTEAMIFAKSKDGKTQNYSLIMKNEFDMMPESSEEGKRCQTRSVFV